MNSGSPCKRGNLPLGLIFPAVHSKLPQSKNTSGETHADHRNPIFIHRD